MVLLSNNEMLTLAILTVLVLVLQFFVAVFEDVAESKPYRHKDQEHHSHEYDSHFVQETDAV